MELPARIFESLYLTIILGCYVLFVVSEEKKSAGKDRVGP